MIKIKSYFYKTHKLNRLKYDEIYNYALQVNDYRNTISNYIYEDIKLLRELRFNKISKVDLINKYKLKYNIASTTKQQQIYETNADYNASVNIKERVTENVFQKALSINNGVNTYLPKYDKRYKFKLELNLILNLILNQSTA